uniref:cGMP-dependent protein kinase n=1 Tax=Entomoneis paludosa TaxID=265537 RepID=A0A7S2VFD7_9STRA
MICRGGERTDLKKASEADPNQLRPVERGQYFGDQVLQPAGDLMWLDTPLRVKAVEDGLCYVIDRPTFEAVVGPLKEVLLTPEAARNIQKMDILKQHPGQEFTIDQMKTIQSKIEEVFYSANETIIEADMPVPAALYYIRQGTVKIMTGRFHRLRIAGGFFGEDLFEEAKANDELKGTVENSILAKVNCVCGRLSMQDFLSLDLQDLSFKKDSDEGASKSPQKAAINKKKVVVMTKKEKAERLLNKANQQESTTQKKPQSSKIALSTVEERKKPKAKVADSSDDDSSSSGSSSSGSSSSSSSSDDSAAKKKPVKKQGTAKKASGSPPISEISTKPKAVDVVDEEEEEIEYIIPKRDFKFENLDKKVMLGEGQFGQVWLVTDKTETEKRAYALKIQSKYDLVSQGQAEVCIREKNIMSQMHHPHIIKLFWSHQDPDFVYLLLEMVNGGELFNRIHPIDEDFENAPQNIGIPEDHARFYAFIVADMLKYMHEKKYVYRDLKPENVLISHNGFPVLIDFGFTKKLTEKTFTLCGTPGYLAPEMVTSQGHMFGADHWALGIMTYQMLCKENFFFPDGMDPVTLYKCIAEDEFEPPTDRCSPEGCDFMDQLLQKDPVMRLGSLAGGENDVLRHKWFTGMDPKKIRTQQLTPPWVPNIKDPLDTTHFEDWSDIEDKTQERYPTLNDNQALIFEDF